MSVFDRQVSYAPHIRPLALGFSTGNRKLQFAVTRFQFRVAGISNFRKAFIVKCRPVVFPQVKVHHFYRPKNRDNSFIRVQKSNKHIADG